MGIKPGFVLVFAGESAETVVFLGGAGFRPSTVWPYGLFHLVFLTASGFSFVSGRMSQLLFRSGLPLHVPTYGTCLEKHKLEKDWASTSHELDRLKLGFPSSLFPEGLFTGRLQKHKTANLPKFIRKRWGPRDVSAETPRKVFARNSSFPTSEAGFHLRRKVKLRNLAVDNSERVPKRH